MRKFAAAVAALTVATVPTYADAAISTFAQYTQVATARDMVYKAATTGTGGTLSSRKNVNSAPGTLTSTLFNFLINDGSGNDITPLAASLSFSATTTATAVTAGNLFVLGGFAGTFDFKSTTAFTINGIDYAVGTDLLKGVFTNASLVGIVGGTSGGVFDSTLANITYSSDVASFVGDKNNDLSFALTSVTAPFAVNGAGRLAGFSAAATGSFSSDPTPTLATAAVPELATWSMMVMGLGLIGGTIRSRRIKVGIRLPAREVVFA